MKVLSFEKDRCEKVRRQLDPYLSNELLVETAGEVLQHLENCPECSRDLETRMRVRERLRALVARQEAPVELRNRIHRQLRASQPPKAWSVPRMRWLAALAATALLVGGGLVTSRWLRVRSTESALEAALRLGVQDHIHCALEAKNYPAVPPTPEEMRVKLGSQYGDLVPIVMEKLPGYRILDGHICQVAGSPRKYIHFITKKGETILSLVLTRKERESLAQSGLRPAETASGAGLYPAHLQGMDVAAFETRDYLGFVVSDLDSQEVYRIASVLRPPFQKLLARSES